MEGNTYEPVTSSAGCSIAENAQCVDMNMIEIIKSYHVASFTSKCYSAQMWALYACNYDGICFVFRAVGTLSNAIPVEYSDSATKREKVEFESISNIDDKIMKSLMIKQKDWSYENEWRLIQKNSGKFICFEKGELIGIIIGEKTNKEVSSLLYDTALRNQLIVYKTFTRPYASHVYIVPWEYTYTSSGEKVEDSINGYYSEHDNIPRIDILQ